MSIGRNGLYIYSSNLLNMVLGYIFWILIANYSGTEGPASIGTISAAVSFSTMMASVLLLGIPSGIQKFIGKEYGEHNLASIASLITSSMILTLMLSIVASIVIVSLGEQAVSIIKLPWEFLMASMILLVALVIQQLLSSSLIAISQSHFLLFGTIMQNASKIIIVIIFLINGYGLTALLVSYLASTILSLPILSLGIVRRMPKIRKISFRADISRLLKASSVNWVPTIVSTIGGQLSVLIVFGYSGAVEAGEYYVASIVFSAAIAVPMAIINAAFPVLSRMVEQSKEITSRITKIGLMFSSPLSVIVAIYSTSLLRLLNPHFGNASLPTMLFMIAVIPTVLNYSVYYLLYALGKYRNVLIIGLVENITKVVLYFILVPQYGVLGAVISFISGPSLAVLVISVTQRTYYAISWRKVIMIIAVPLGTGFIAYFLKLDSITGVSAIISVSFYLYLKLSMVNIRELREIIYSILPGIVAKRIYPKVEDLVRAIHPKPLFSDP